jgi:hypothetical protein
MDRWAKGKKRRERRRWGKYSPSLSLVGERRIGLPSRHLPIPSIGWKRRTPSVQNVCRGPKDEWDGVDGCFICPEWSRRREEVRISVDGR